jgi:hypothetical protein
MQKMRREKGRRDGRGGKLGGDSSNILRIPAAPSIKCLRGDERKTMTKAMRVIAHRIGMKAIYN